MKMCLFIISLFCCLSIHAQTDTTSLKEVWENEKIVDSLRFNALEAYYDVNNQTQPDLALVSLEYYYTLAKEKKATKHMYSARKKKGNIYRLKSDYDKAMRAYKEAENLAIQLKDPSLQAAILGNIGTIFIYRQNYQQATQNYSNALKFYQEVG